MSTTRPQQNNYGGGGNRALEDYVSVHMRVEKFKREHPSGRILTSIVSTDPLVFRAEIYIADSDVPTATGHASEDGGMGARSKSAFEKTETAAVGRALAFCGYEVKDGIASREEIEKAGVVVAALPDQPRTQPATRPVAVVPANPKTSAETLDGQIMTALEILKKTEDDADEICRNKYSTFGAKGYWAEMTVPQKEWLLGFLNKKIDQMNAERESA